MPFSSGDGWHEVEALLLVVAHVIRSSSTKAPTRLNNSPLFMLTLYKPKNAPLLPAVMVKR